MIRRSPTRIELKLDDLNDFDYIQKFDKKKSALGVSGGVVSSADAQKLIRQERIGLGFRPIRSSSNVGTTSQGSISTPPAVVIGAGGVLNLTSSGVLGATSTPSANDITPVEMNISNTSAVSVSTVNEGPSIDLIPEEDVARANNSTMSFDESL